MNINNSEKGRSMIEMLGVLAIVGILSVAGISGYSRAMEEYKSNQLKSQIQAIATNLIILFQNERDYSALGSDKTYGTTMAVALDVVPSEMVQDDGTLLNPFNGNVYIYAIDYYGTPDGAFKIEMDGLPQRVALELGMDGTNVQNQTLMNIELSPETN